MNFARIWCITNRTPARRVTPPWTFTWQNLTPAERVNRSGRPDYPRWRVTLRIYHVNMIKLKWEIIWTPTWGPPPPCKQALSSILYWSHCLVLLHIFQKVINNSWAHHLSRPLKSVTCSCFKPRQNTVRLKSLGAVFDFSLRGVRGWLYFASLIFFTEKFHPR